LFRRLAHVASGGTAEYQYVGLAHLDGTPGGYGLGHVCDAFPGRLGGFRVRVEAVRVRDVTQADVSVLVLSRNLAAEEIDVALIGAAAL